MVALIAHQYSSSKLRSSKVGKMAKTTKGHNFVKNMTIENPESHAHLQVNKQRSARFQINLIKDVERAVGTWLESARAIS